MLKAMRKNAMVLAIFALVCTAVVTLTHLLTESKIVKQQEKQLMDILNQVVPPNSHNNLLYKSCIFVKNEKYLGTRDHMKAYVATLNGKPTGIAIEGVAPNGYSGAIKLVVGLQADGTVTGVRILEENETPGLGDKIKKRVSNWVDSFVGKKVEGPEDKRWAVQKDGGQFDQFTGATITPRAVVGAVKNISLYFEENKQALFQHPLNCPEEK